MSALMPSCAALTKDRAFRIILVPMVLLMIIAYSNIMIDVFSRPSIAALTKNHCLLGIISVMIVCGIIGTFEFFFPGSTGLQVTVAKCPTKTADTKAKPTETKLQAERKNEDGLICSITHALPLDPVTAEDGQIYERTAIEDYFESKGDGHPITSPITRQVIGTKLLPSPQIKKTIETLIENGAITGEPADDWKRRMMKRKKCEDLLKWEDLEEAYKWYEKARVSGSVYGLARVGEYLVAGCGVAQNVAKGLIYLGLAAGQGSDFAAYILGMYMADGDNGVPVDKAVAQRLLEKSLGGTCPYKNMIDAWQKEAQEKLDELNQDLLGQ